MLQEVVIKFTFIKQAEYSKQGTLTHFRSIQHNTVEWKSANCILEYGDKYDYIDHGCTNPGHQVAHMTKFCVVVPNICGSSV